MPLKESLNAASAIRISAMMDIDKAPSLNQAGTHSSSNATKYHRPH